MHTITPFIWFNDGAEEAMNLYVKVFKNGRITDLVRHGDRVHYGTVEIGDLRFHCFNGGPYFKLTEAFSLMVEVDTQEEVDRLWSALTTDGGQESQCGWLKDKFGVSWQITPRVLLQLLNDKDPGRAKRATDAMMTMKKIDIAALQRAANSATA